MHPQQNRPRNRARTAALLTTVLRRKDAREVAPLDLGPGAPAEDSPPQTLPVSGFTRLTVAQTLSTGAVFFLESLTKLALVLLLPGASAITGLGISTALDSLPRLALPSVTGRLADRLDRVLIMRLSLLARVVLALALLGAALGWYREQVRLAVVIVGVSFLSICIAQFFNPARMSFAQAIIPAAKRPEAAALAQFSLNGVAVLAASAGPLVFALLGAVGSAAVILLMELLALVVLRRLRDHAHVVRAAEDGKGGVGGAVRLSWRMLPAPVFLVVFLTASYGLVSGTINLALPLVILRERHIPTMEYGLITGAFAAGGVLGALVVARVIRLFGAGRTLVGSVLCMAGLYALFSALAGLWAMVAVMGVLGVMISAFSAAQGPLLQEHVPNAVMGQLFGRQTLISTVAMLFGTALGVAGAWGPEENGAHYHVLIGVGAAVLAALALLGSAWCLGLQRRRASSAQPSNEEAS